MSNSEQWIFTFGFGHYHPETGEPLANRYVVIPGTFSDARQKMVVMFGVKWSMQYASKEEAGVEIYGLRELKL
jgi:hypothetical protein